MGIGMEQGGTVQKEKATRITAGLVFLLLLWPTISMAGDVTLAWDSNSETNLAGYKLYYDGDADTEMYGGTDANEGDSPVVIYMEDLADPEAPTFTLTGLTDGEYYYFSLTAFDSDGVESDFSDEVGVLIGAALPVSSSGDTDSADASTTTSAAEADNASSAGGCFIMNTAARPPRIFPAFVAGIFLLLTAGIRSTRNAGQPPAVPCADEKLTGTRTAATSFRTFSSGRTPPGADKRPRLSSCPKKFV